MTIGTRIATARRERGIPQARLAEVIDRDVSAISRLESGDRRLSSFELGLIANELGITMRWILGMEEAPDAMALAARVDEAMRADEAMVVLADVRDMFELEAILDQIGIDEETRPDVALVVPDTDPVAAGRSMAIEARRFLGIGDGPLGEDLPGVMENHFGLDVMLLPLGGGLLGGCVKLGGRAVAVAEMTDRVGRRRFTLAHELGHYLFDDADGVVIENTERMFGVDPVETRASTFAANFIAPSVWLEAHVSGREVTPERVVELALEAGLSYTATVFHLHNSRLLNGAEHRDALNRVPARQAAARSGRSVDWAYAQRSYSVKRPASRVVQRARVAYTSGKVGVRPVADAMLRDDLEELRNELLEVESDG